ncbi:MULTISPECIES: YjdF family protein [Paenibacillus]|uniref:YjdF family protein n=1 Tax=Paenibacillus TaxID=44249 RepID=UPI0022823A10|nr:MULTISPECIES: YjdF family protein [Paenibacillus]MCY7484911.1 YjdF family protein [Paenibacillus alvei]
MKLTVFFEGPFWIGIVEDTVHGRLKACRHVFGAEPKDAEVLEFVEVFMMPLIERVTQTAVGAQEQLRRINPKRLARRAAMEMKQRGISTQSQEALRLDYESRKKERTCRSREEREALQEKKRSIRIQKRKEKHRGR